MKLLIKETKKRKQNKTKRQHLLHKYKIKIGIRTYICIRKHFRRANKTGVFQDNITTNTCSTQLKTGIV